MVFSKYCWQHNIFSMLSIVNRALRARPIDPAMENVLSIDPDEVGIDKYSLA